jgi:hypothetical protein
MTIAPHTAHRIPATRFASFLPLLEDFRQNLPALTDLDVQAVDVDEMRTREYLQTRQALPAWQAYTVPKSGSVPLYSHPATEEYTKTRSPDLLDYIFGLYPVFAGAVLSGCYLYPGSEAKPVAMDWHTNSNTDGWRLYVTHAPEANKSGFCYADTDGEVIDQPDTAGWNFRLFLVKPEYSPFWHCVYAKQPRLSIGFNLGTLPPAIVLGLLCQKD